MLRALVLLLLLANAGFLAWNQGWLDTVLGPVPSGREPERVQRQIRPDALRIVPDAPARPGSSPSSGAGADRTRAAASARGGTSSERIAARAPAGAGCVEAGPFVPVQAAQVEALLRDTFPAHSGVQWVVDRQEQPAPRMVFRFDEVSASQWGTLQDLTPRLFGHRFAPCAAGAAGLGARPAG